MKTIDYDSQAITFLESHGLRFEAVNHGDKSPPWAENNEAHGDHYRVTITGTGRGRLTFSFWDSVNARKNSEPLTPYSVLSCMSSDTYCPDTFEEFCGEYGYDSDSRRALAIFRRCASFSKRLRAFFTEDELSELQEIQ